MADPLLSQPQRFWSETAAIVSPHRAQNAAIRQHLPDHLRSGAFVETVDRIQGKERDAVILSYCVADPEFALAEGEFIFSSERLNVAVTRARSKLVMIISRRLLEAVPAEQETMDKAELLREFVYSCAEVAETKSRGQPGGSSAFRSARAALWATMPSSTSRTSPLQLSRKSLNSLLSTRASLRQSATSLPVASGRRPSSAM
jgi:hypothetical protein